MGTPAYMAPEQARRAKRRGDAGQRPVQPGRGAVRAAVRPNAVRGRRRCRWCCSTHPHPSAGAREHRADVPVALETICLKALARTGPAERYGTCQELAAALQGWLEGEAVPPDPLQCRAPWLVAATAAARVDCALVEWCGASRGSR